MQKATLYQLFLLLNRLLHTPIHVSISAFTLIIRKKENKNKHHFPNYITLTRKFNQLIFARDVWFNFILSFSLSLLILLITLGFKQFFQYSLSPLSLIFLELSK